MQKATTPHTRKALIHSEPSHYTMLARVPSLPRKYQIIKYHYHQGSKENKPHEHHDNIS